MNARPNPLLVSRERQPNNTVIPLGRAQFGSRDFPVIAGPCAVENLTQTVQAAHEVTIGGATALRGGAFKPRTSPYSFQGLGEEGLRILAEARRQTGLPVVTEVLDASKIEMVARYADMLQVGARNMQNFALLEALGKTHKPVLLKRGQSATLNEFLHAAEYIVANGNPNVILCERGIRTFGSDTRNTLDIAAIPVLKARTHLPVIVDPSHACGLSDVVPHLARAALAVGVVEGPAADGEQRPVGLARDGQRGVEQPRRARERRRQRDARRLELRGERLRLLGEAVRRGARVRERQLPRLIDKEHVHAAVQRVACKRPRRAADQQLVRERVDAAGRSCRVNGRRASAPNHHRQP